MRKQVQIMSNGLMIKRLFSLFTISVLTFVVGASKADDTEIFTGVIEGGSGLPNSGFFPNVLFILDNSTSMGSTEPVLDRIIDLKTPIVGNDNDCTVDLNSFDPDFDYSFGTNSNDSLIYIYTQTSYSGKTVTQAQNQCKAYNDRVVNGAEPYIRSQIIQWGRDPDNNSRYRWDNSISRMDTNASSGTECRADLNIHGHFTRNTGDRRPRNWRRVRDNSDIGQHYFTNAVGSNPYNGAQNVFWVSGNYHRYLRLRAGIDNVPSTCQILGGPPVDPFDSSLPLGSKDNPNEATSITQMCGGPGVEDRDPTTGRSRLNFNNGTVYYKNRYYKLKDPSSNDIIRVYRCQTRLDTMKEALSRVIEDEVKINAGLMRFNANNGATPGGGTIIADIAPMNNGENKRQILEEIENLEFGNATPLAESLYEAYLYFSGGEIDQGRKTLGSWDEKHATFEKDFLNLELKDRTDFVTDPRARASNRYVSPIRNQCQPNSIVLLSDGEPTGDNNRDGEIGALTGNSCSSCSDDIAAYMKNNDIDSRRNVNANVNTYTIGLNLDSNTLRNIAAAGAANGVNGYFTANDTNGLELAFRSILGAIESTEADVFSAPAVTVNAFNRLQNRNEIYYALFKPENSARWGGNVKKYFVDGSTSTIVDQRGNDAIDVAEGFFKETAQSDWSDDVDGNTVNQGGAGEQVKFARRMFGNIDGVDTFLSSTDVGTAEDVFLEKTKNVVLGASTAGGDSVEENKSKIARWTLGLDIDNERENNGTPLSNQYIGDSLHGTPYVVSYGDDIDTPLDVIFYTSNQGLLHAIDGETGNELWSYVVDESLFENLGVYYNNERADKVYGLDGEIAFNVTRDPETEDVEIDRARLFFGQRRGGNKVFSVDVTNAREGGNSPVQRKWVIQGGVNGTPGFERMGQTWAEPVVTDVTYCDDDLGCDPKDDPTTVVFLTGGYDEFYDDQTKDVADAPSQNVLGNAIYMVNENTGELLWMIGSDESEVAKPGRDLVIPEMKHSIVSAPTILDTDGNGRANVMFFIDVSGQVFRVDFRTALADTDDISSGDNFGTKDGGIDSISGGLIATFAEDRTNRRFYNPLDITTLRAQTNANGEVTAPVRYAITTGSGYRAHPLDPEPFGNRLYVIYDSNVVVPKQLDGKPDYQYAGTEESPEVIVGDEDLVALDINVGGTSSLGDALGDQVRDFSLSGPLPQTGAGYFLNLPGNAEKLINPAVISEFRLLTVSYVPSGSNAANLKDKCEAGLGQSILYSIDLRTGEGREVALNNPGISPSPVIIYVPDDPVFGVPTNTAEIKPVVVIGTEPIDGEAIGLEEPDLGKALKRAWWETNRGE